LGRYIDQTKAPSYSIQGYEGKWIRWKKLTSQTSPINVADDDLSLRLEHTEPSFPKSGKSPGEDWPKFAKTLRRLLGDAIRLWRRREELSTETHASRRDRIHRRLAELIDTPWKDSNAKRLVKRFRRHQDELFTFLDQEGVPFDNNHAERSIRPAVHVSRKWLRKNSPGNRSQKGADCQAVLMSVFRTLKQRGHDPIRTVTAALAEYLATGKLPPLPAATSDG